MSKLYEISSNYKNLESLMENGDIPVDAIIEGLSQIETEFDEKVINVIKVIKNFESDIATLKTEENRLGERRKSFEKKVKGLKNYIHDNMKVLHKEKISNELFTVKVKNNPPKVIVDDVSLLDDKYIKTEIKANLTAIGEVLKGDGVVEGARLERDTSLSIK